jgi:hypothetical protein
MQGYVSSSRLAGGYFVSDEAEGAAKWKAVENHAKNKQHMVALKTSLSEIGKSLEKFGATIQRLDGAYSIDVGDQAISVGHREHQRMMAHLSRQQMDWDALCRLLSDYSETKRALMESTGAMNDLNINP